MRLISDLGIEKVSLAAAGLKAAEVAMGTADVYFQPARR